jgi:hypothetical protein
MGPWAMGPWAVPGPGDPGKIITCPTILALPCRLEATSAKFVTQSFLALPPPPAEEKAEDNA